MTFLSSVPVKIKGLVVLIIFCFQAPPEPLPAEDSMFQFVLLLWFSIFFFCSWALLEKMSHVLCFTGSSCWQLIWGWCPCLAFLVSSQLHKDCLCFPQLLLLALLHLANVLSETRSVVWICVALGWASWVSLQGACQERAMQTHPDWPYLDPARSVSPSFTFPAKGVSAAGHHCFKAYVYEGKVEATVYVGSLDFFVFVVIKDSPSWCGSSGLPFLCNILPIIPLRLCFYYYFHMMLQSFHAGSNFLVMVNKFL